MQIRNKLLKIKWLVAIFFVFVLNVSCTDEPDTFLIRGFLFTDNTISEPVSYGTLSFVFASNEQEIGTAKTDKRGRFAFLFTNEGLINVNSSKSTFWFINSNSTTSNFDVDIYYQGELIYTINTQDILDGNNTIDLYPQTPQNQ